MGLNFRSDGDLALTSGQEAGRGLLSQDHGGVPGLFPGEQFFEPPGSCGAAPGSSGHFSQDGHTGHYSSHPGGLDGVLGEGPQDGALKPGGHNQGRRLHGHHQHAVAAGRRRLIPGQAEVPGRRRRQTPSPGLGT